MSWRLISLAILFLFIGCASEFACKETIDGVRCKNLRAVYDEKVLTATEVYNSKVIGPSKKTEKKDGPVTEAEKIVRSLENDGSRPIRIPPVILRIWTAPWEDADGDLHKPGYIYCEINQKRGRWLFGESSTSGTTIPYQVSITRISKQEDKKPDNVKGTNTKKGVNNIKSDVYYGDKPDPNMPKLKLSK